MATIKQIAALAGVSRGTVDRVLNNRGIVNKETAQRVREIAESLNYTPNKAARSLSVLKHGMTLGFILFPSDKNQFFAQMEAGIKKKSDELSEYGVSVIVRYGDYLDPTLQDRLIDEMVANSVDGIAICGFNTPSTAAKIRELSKKGIPVVTSNTDIPDSGRLSYVGSDYVKAGRTAGRLMHLITSGYVNLSIILGSYDILCHNKRLEGFTSYIKEHAPNISVSHVYENSDDDYKSFSIVNDIFSSNNTTNALFLASAGAYGACKAVEALPKDRRPVIISYDCVPSIIPMLQNGIISATICQQPDYQGGKPLDILFNYLAMDIPPSREFYYTNNEIVINESL